MSLKRQTFLFPVHFRLIRRPWIRCYLIGMLIASNSEIQTHQSSTGSVKTVKPPNSRTKYEGLLRISIASLSAKKKSYAYLLDFPPNAGRKQRNLFCFRNLYELGSSSPLVLVPPPKDLETAKKIPPVRSVSISWNYIRCVAQLPPASASQSVSGSSNKSCLFGSGYPAGLEL